MEKFFGDEIKDEKQREMYLRDNCNGVEERSYMKRFTPEQLAQFKEELANNSVSISSISEEKKIAADAYKNRLKPLTDRVHTLVSCLKTKAELVKENCYKFIDQEARTTGYYNAAGELVEERPATGDELDPNIFNQIRQIKKDKKVIKLTGTNN